MPVMKALAMFGPTGSTLAREAGMATAEAASEGPKGSL